MGIEGKIGGPSAVEVEAVAAGFPDADFCLVLAVPADLGSLIVADSGKTSKTN